MPVNKQAIDETGSGDIHDEINSRSGNLNRTALVPLALLNWNWLGLILN